MSYHEAKVARVHDLRDGEMKKISIEDQEVLLARVNGDFYAVYPKCTHYGGPLDDGVLHGHRLVCPWHHACFDVSTGEHLEAPGLDGLPSYEVRVEGEDVFVRVPRDGADRRPNPMSERDADDDRLYVVLGGGAAGAYAAEGMRQAGYQGRILMITAEDDLPYDRPNCSKAYLSGEAPEEWMPLRDDGFYRKHGIEVLRGQTVTRVDGPNKRIEFAGRDPLHYDKLALCTGAVPRRLSVPGMDLKRVYTLRSLNDSRRLRRQAGEEHKVVVIGASFIGLESAASLREQGCLVTVVAPEEVPMARIFGERIGKLLRQMHESAGINFELGRRVERLEGPGAVERVVLDNNRQLDADFVLVGIGVKPNTGFFKGIPLETDGSIRTDGHLQVYDDLYAAGDIARFPYQGSPTRIEHWQVACQQGRIAGMNMAGENLAYEAIPFFWTRQHGHSLAYFGHAAEFDRIIYQGKVEEKKFLAFYIQDGEVRAVAGMASAELPVIHELMRAGQLPSPEAIEAGEVNWREHLQAAEVP